MLKNSIKITRVKGSTGICKKTQFKQRARIQFGTKKQLL